MNKPKDDVKTNNYIRWKIHNINGKYYLYNKQYNGYLFFKINEQQFTIISKSDINTNSNLIGILDWYCMASSIICDSNYYLNNTYYEDK
jgi:hypothetical protein